MESCGDYDEINDNQPVGDYETTNDYCSTPPVPPLSEHEIPMATMEYKIPVSTLGKVCCVRYDYYYRTAGYFPVVVFFLLILVQTVNLLMRKIGPILSCTKF